MPARIIAFVCLIMQAPCLLAQNLQFDGLYLAKTGQVASVSSDDYTCLRFYPDGAVFLQSVATDDVKSVSKWFGRNKRYEQKGTYQMKDGAIELEFRDGLNPESVIAGIQSTRLQGTVAKGALELNDSTKRLNMTYVFHGLQDTTTVVKYNRYRPELRLPGEWQLQQQGGKDKGQVYLTNEDSTVLAICVMPGESLDVFVRERTDFENALAYFNSDARTLREESRMTVRKLSENREKAYICCQAKNGQNNMYFLFATRGNLLYNCMIKAPDMPEQEKINLLEKVFEMNHL